MEPYYSDDLAVLYLGDCREITEWLSADVLVTDPPYGRGWKQGNAKKPWQQSDKRDGIVGDLDTATRDAALGLWGDRRAGVVFGDLMLAPPSGTKQVLVYRKPSNAGTKGTFAGRRRDVEAVYLVGPWPAGLGGRTSVLTTAARSQGGSASNQGRYQHSHAKPLDVMESLISDCPQGLVADPFAGSGSTLVAARNQGRRAIGIEIEECHCETAAKRLAQNSLFTATGAG